LGFDQAVAAKRPQTETGKDESSKRVEIRDTEMRLLTSKSVGQTYEKESITAAFSPTPSREEFAGCSDCRISHRSGKDEDDQ
jgi:hypothetical protein